MIDLGELAPRSEEDPPEWTPPSSITSWRWAKALAVVALCLATFAQPAPPARMTLLAQVQVSAETRFILADADLIVTDGSTLKSYRDGRPLWTLPRVMARPFDLARHGDVVVVSGAEGEETASAGVDLHTGQLLWKMPTPVWITGGHVLTWGEDSTVQVHSLRDGRALWTSTVHGLVFGIDHVRSVLGTLDPDGSLVERALSTGEVVRKAQLAPSGVTPSDMVYTPIGLIITWMVNETSGEGHRYDIDTLRESPDNGFFYDDCGEFFCRSMANEPGIELVNRSTGLVSHRMLGWKTARPTASGLLALAFHDEARRLELFKPADGSRIVVPAAWVLLSERSLGDQSPRGDSRPGDELLVKDIGDDLYLAELRGDGLHMLGVLPHPFVSGHVVSGRMLAYRVGQQIWWWRLG